MGLLVFPLKIAERTLDSREIKAERRPSPRWDGELAGLFQAERSHTGPESSVTQQDHSLMTSREE